MERSRRTFMIARQDGLVFVLLSELIRTRRPVPCTSCPERFSASQRPQCPLAVLESSLSGVRFVSSSASTENSSYALISSATARSGLP